MRSILFIGIAGLLSACSTINYVGIETYNPAEVTFPENVAKVLIVNNAVPQPEDAGYEFTMMRFEKIIRRFWIRNLPKGK